MACAAEIKKHNTNVCSSKWHKKSDTQHCLFSRTFCLRQQILKISGQVRFNTPAGSQEIFPFHMKALIRTTIQVPEEFPARKKARVAR